MSKEILVSLDALSFSWSGSETATLEIDHLEVKEGEHLFIKGASGSGKTTLLNLLTGVTTPQKGSVTMLDHALEKLSNTQRDRFRADYLGVIFQQFNLLPYLSILENVQLPCWFSAKRKEQAGDVEASAKILLEHLDIGSKMLDSPIHKLSVGQQQRVAVARALIGKPKIIIADEPTSALDSDNRKRFLDLLFKESEAQGSTLIFVSHDPSIKKQFPRIIELETINRAGK